MQHPNAEIACRLEAAAASGFNRWLRFDVSHASPGRVELQVQIRPEMRQHLGTVHGGCLGALADVACAYAAGLAVGADVTTASYSIHFLLPVRGSNLRVTGRAIRVGQRQVTVEAQIFDLDRGPADEGELRAQALAAVSVLAGRDG